MAIALFVRNVHNFHNKCNIGAFNQVGLSHDVKQTVLDVVFTNVGTF